MTEQERAKATEKKRSRVMAGGRIKKLGESYTGDLVLHIGKTGGTHMGDILRHLKPAKDRMRLFSHTINAKTAVKTCPNARIVFSVRDPLSLFVSAFNSRLRKGQPRFYSEWTTEEAVAFRMFQTPNDLAEALSSSNTALQACAEFSMLSIKHVSKCLNFYLDSEKFLERRRDRIAFILDQACLDADLEAYCKRLGLNYAAPSSDSEDAHTHKAPESYARELSAQARENLALWYAKDMRIYDWCIRNKDRINGPAA